MNEEIIITTPKPEDAEGIQKVYDETWLATYPNEEAGITREDILDKRKDSMSEERLEKRRAYYSAIPNNEKIFIAKKGKYVIGVCSLIQEEARNKLTTMYVLPEYHGQGIGQMLWNTLLPFFNNGKDTFVEVAAYNNKAISFYKRCGFVDTGRRFADEKFSMKSGAVIPEIEMVVKANK